MQARPAFRIILVLNRHASRPVPTRRLPTWLLPALLLSLPVLSAAAPATLPSDPAARRVLACTLCHGAQGRAAADGFHPRLAGKPEGYLYQQLLAFRDGRRQYGLMTNLLDPLSDAVLQDMARHFANLSLPYPAPQPATAPAALLERGRRLATDGDAARQLPACSACHGAALTGVLPSIPGLLGLPRDYLNAQLGAWRAGSRRAQAPDCMASIARRLGPEDITALAQWLASQPLPADPRPVAAATQAAARPLDCGGVAP
jgi:cytochrome c553